jgi:hypothetical protein
VQSPGELPAAHPPNHARVIEVVDRAASCSGGEGTGAAFILTALAVLGGSSLVDFALALLIGLVVGMYSPVFTAAPVAVALHRRGNRGQAGAD